MMLRSISFIVGILLFPVLHGQAKLDTSLVRFSSGLEQELLLSYEGASENPEDFIRILLAADQDFDRERIDEIVQTLNAFSDHLQARYGQSKPKKKIKQIFGQIHDRFFKRYQDRAQFADIFSSLTYNCVGGTILYAYIFDRMEIPFQVKETPTHVFLVAYPQTDNIMVETTAPGSYGWFRPSEQMLKSAVEDLIKMKVLTEQEAVAKGYEKAFNDYFYGDENIGWKDLVGIEYMNRAIWHYQDKAYEPAYSEVSKADLFYGKEKVALYRNALLATIIDEMDFTDPENFKWYLGYIRNGSDLEYMQFKLNRILDGSNWDDTELDKAEAALGQYANEAVRSPLLEQFYEFRADRYIKLQNLNKALSYSEKIYGINPENLTAQNHICVTNINTLGSKNVVPERIQELSQLVQKYPFMSNFGIYNVYRIYLYSGLAARAFDQNQADEAEVYLQEMVQLLREVGEDVSFNEQAVGHAFASQGAYLYRTQRKKEAIECLRKGLEFSPENPNIQRKLDLIQSSY